MYTDTFRTPRGGLAAPRNLPGLSRVGSSPHPPREKHRPGAAEWAYLQLEILIRSSSHRVARTKFSFRTRKFQGCARAALGPSLLGR